MFEMPPLPLQASEQYFRGQLFQYSNTFPQAGQEVVVFLSGFFGTALRLRHRCEQYF
jgi:hypothetical protein